MPNAVAIDGAEFRSRVFLDMTKVMVGLAAYEKEHGHYPENLEELVPEFFKTVPLDRYSNGPFQYDVVDGEVVLYSVGDNRIDENGEYGYSKNGEQNDDWMLEGQIRSWDEFIEELK